MTNKSVIIRRSGGGDDKVDVQLDLCSYYREIVKGLSKSTADRDEFRRQLELIVWGSFYIEAAMNKTLSMMIDDSVRGILVPEDIAGSLERSNLENKVALILSKLGENNEQKVAFRKSTIGLFALRNRLVHPKEKPEQTDLVISDLEDIGPAIATARKFESKLEKEMFGTDFSDRKNTILTIGGWFEAAIFEHYKRPRAA